MKKEDWPLIVTVLGVAIGVAGIAGRWIVAGFVGVVVMFGGLLWQLRILEKKRKEKR